MLFNIVVVLARKKYSRGALLPQIILLFVLCPSMNV
jgi:hypothetical protein